MSSNFSENSSKLLINLLISTEYISTTARTEYHSIGTNSSFTLSSIGALATFFLLIICIFLVKCFVYNPEDQNSQEIDLISLNGAPSIKPMSAYILHRYMSSISPTAGSGGSQYSQKHTPYEAAFEPYQNSMPHYKN